MILDFGNENIRYKFILEISIEDVDMEEKEIKKCYIEIKKYNDIQEVSQLIKNDANIKNVNDSYILKLISQLSHSDDPNMKSNKDTDLEDITKN